MIKRQNFLSVFSKMLWGICCEMLATVIVMAVIFGIGFMILGWFSK